MDYPTLDDYKTAIMGLADLECQRRFALGFTHSTKQFSLSLPAQINHNAGQHRKAKWTTDAKFPLNVSTIDNQDSLSLADEAALDAITDAAGDYALTTHQDCQTVKNNIRAAVDVAAVDTTASSYLGGGAP